MSEDDQLPQTASTTAGRLKDVAKYEPGMGGYNFSDLGETVEFAGLMAKAGPMVPEFMRGEVGICLAIAMRAKNWNLDPFALALESYQAKRDGPVGYQAKVFVAALKSMTGIKLKFRYEGEITFTGKPAMSKGQYAKEIAKNEAGGSRSCIAYANVDGELLEFQTQMLSEIGVKNSPLWHNKPDLQLAYSAARDWIRLYEPGVIMGAMSVDEADDYDEPRDITPASPSDDEEGFINRLKNLRNPQPEEKAEAVDDVKGETIDVKAEEAGDAPETEDVKDAEEIPEPTDNEIAGGKACLDGFDRDQCPHKPRTKARKQWLLGWDKASGAT